MINMRKWNTFDNIPIYHHKALWCDHLLESSFQDDSNEWSHHMVSWSKKYFSILITHVIWNPGVKIHRHCHHHNLPVTELWVSNFVHQTLFCDYHRINALILKSSPKIEFNWNTSRTAFFVNFSKCPLLSENSVLPFLPFSPEHIFFLQFLISTEVCINLKVLSTFF